jgi:hypothetical protein
MRTGKKMKLKDKGSKKSSTPITETAEKKNNTTNLNVHLAGKKDT